MAARVGAAMDVLWTSARVQLAEMRSNRLVIILGVIQPAVFLLVTLTPQTDPGPAEGARVATGVLLTSFWGSTVWNGAGILRRERFQGTLAATLTGVRDPRLVIIGKSLGASLGSTAAIAATVAVMLLGLRQPVALGNPGWIVVGLAVVLTSGTAVGMLIGGIFVLTRYGPQVSSALMYPVFLLGGMLIPPELIPIGLRWLSWLISLRWAQEFLVGASTGSVRLFPLLLAVLLTVGYAVGGAVAFRRVIDLARDRGTLELL